MSQDQEQKTSVTVYTRPWCGYCTRALSVFAARGIEVDEIDIGKEPGRRAEMVERSGGANTFPQIFIGSTHVGGCTDLLMLDVKGDLDRMLESEEGAA